MKLLAIARNYQHFTSRQVTYHLLSALAEITDLTVWHDRGEPIQDILSKLNIEPDFILILEYYETNATKITGLSSLKIPYAISLQDLHWDTEIRTQRIMQENIQHIFSPCRDAFGQAYPELMSKMIWLPHHVDTEVFKDYGLPKEIDFLLMGAASQTYYPLRARILNTMKDKSGFTFHKHPGYREFCENEDLFVGAKYAREINRAKIFFTCGGSKGYPVAKYFEVLACNTLLLAPELSELTDLGFIPMQHFVPIDLDDFEEKAEYFLTHETERMQIARQGFEMVQARHSSAQRAAEAVAAMEKIIQSSGGKLD